MVTGKMPRSLNLHPSRRVRRVGGKPASEADAIHFLDHVFQKSLLLLIFVSILRAKALWSPGSPGGMKSSWGVVQVGSQTFEVRLPEKFPEKIALASAAPHRQLPGEGVGPFPRLTPAELLQWVRGCRP